MLREREHQFARAVLAGDAALLPAVVGGTLGAARRIEVYRHNVFGVLTGALEALFPVTRALVGPAFFAEAARQYIEATPSTSGDIGRFGAQWAGFLEAYPHAADLPYLPDVARLEWARDQCFHAAEASPLDLAKLARVPPVAHGELRFSLHPAARLLASPYPVASIWQVHQPGHEEDEAVAWNGGGETVLVRRSAADEVQVVIESIPAAEHAFLLALADGGTLEDAADAAFGVDDAIDLQGLLVRFVQCGVIVDFSGGGT